MFSDMSLENIINAISGEFDENVREKSYEELYNYSKNNTITVDDFQKLDYFLETTIAFCNEERELNLLNMLRDTIPFLQQGLQDTWEDFIRNITNDTTQPEELMDAFNRVFNDILSDVFYSQPEETCERFEELVEFVEDNQDIIEDTDRQSFYDNLQYILLNWYGHGVHQVRDYYSRFFDSEFPSWAFEEEDAIVLPLESLEDQPIQVAPAA